MDKRQMPIGIFDSGIGGLTVVREIIKSLPNEDIVYFGDTARLPYGNKSAQTVIKFSIENVKFLRRFGVKFIIVACNTSSSLALSALKRRFNLPILGVVSPAVKKAVQVSKKKQIGIIATRATVSSLCYHGEIKKICPQAESFAQACPLFVPFAEEGWTNGEITRQVARKYLAPLLKEDIDTLILGCTHYPLLRGVIKKVVGKKVQLVDSATALAAEARRLLFKGNLLAGPKSKTVKCKFFVSDEPAWFQKVGVKFLGKRIQSVQKV